MLGTACTVSHYPFARVDVGVVIGDASGASDAGGVDDHSTCSANLGYLNEAHSGLDPNARGHDRCRLAQARIAVACTLGCAMYCTYGVC